MPSTHDHSAPSPHDHSAEDDHEKYLISRTATGDHTAFESLYDIYHPRLLRFLSRMLSKTAVFEEGQQTQIRDQANNNKKSLSALVSGCSNAFSDIPVHQRGAP